MQEPVVDNSLAEAAPDSVSSSLSVDIEANDSVTADEITIETGVTAEVEVVAASDDEGEILAPADTDEEEVVEAPA